MRRSFIKGPQGLSGAKGARGEPGSRVSYEAVQSVSRYFDKSILYNDILHNN